MPSQEAVEGYSRSCVETVDRLDYVVELLELGIKRRFIEHASLQLRLALETLAYSGLVAHQHALQPLSKNLRKLDADKVQKRVERINPHWWPQPVNKDWRPVERGMTKDQWGPALGFCSEVLHADNPLSDEVDDLEARRARLLWLNASVAELLSSHMVQLDGNLRIFASVSHGEFVRPNGVLVRLVEDERD